MNMEVLLVEDDVDLAATIVDYLALESIECDHAANGIAGLTLAGQARYQVIILDVNLPGMDGFSICKKLRETHSDTPVLMLTARDQLQDKLDGFDAGTDDYLIKPFEIEELLVRLQALAKRRSGQMNCLLKGEITLNVRARTAVFRQQDIRLTPITYRLLEALMRSSPDPVSRESLMTAAWGSEQPDSNSLKVHMYNLRKQMGEVAGSMIKSVPGFGFVLQATDDDQE